MPRTPRASTAFDHLSLGLALFVLLSDTFPSVWAWVALFTGERRGAELDASELGSTTLSMVLAGCAMVKLVPAARTRRLVVAVLALLAGLAVLRAGSVATFFAFNPGLPNEIRNSLLASIPLTYAPLALLIYVLYRLLPPHHSSPLPIAPVPPAAPQSTSVLTYAIPSDRTYPQSRLVLLLALVYTATAALGVVHILVGNAFHVGITAGFRDTFIQLSKSELLPLAFWLIATALAFAACRRHRVGLPWRPLLTACLLVAVLASLCRLGQAIYAILRLPEVLASARPPPPLSDRYIPWDILLCGIAHAVAFPLLLQLLARHRATTTDF